MKSAIRCLNVQLLIFILLTFSVNPIWAAPAAPIFVESKQPNNDTVLIQLRGDEFNSWLETEDGFTVLKNDQGWWVYAVVASDQDHTLIPSSYIVGQDNPSTAGIKPHLHPTILSANRPLPVQPQAQNISPYLVPFPDPAIEDIPLLVILAAYEDANVGCVNCKNTNAVSDYTDKTFGATRSVKHYYASASLNKVAVEPAVESNGVANDGIVGWLDLSGDTPYGTVFSRILTDSQRIYKNNKIAYDALTAVTISNDYVNFADYDINNDGVVFTNELAVVIVLAGYNEGFNRDEDGNLLDPNNTDSVRTRSFTFPFNPVSAGLPALLLDGKTLPWLVITGERHGAFSAGIGPMVHELGHEIFGWPDLYDIDQSSYGIGNWGLMSYGAWGSTATDNAKGETPVLPSAWSRMVQGWITPAIITAGSYSINQASNSTAPTVLKIETINSNEYFLVENRQNDGYDAGLSCLMHVLCDFPGGLAVWHIDESVGNLTNNNVNTNEMHKRVDLEAAEGDSDLDERVNTGLPTNLYHVDHKDHFDSATLPNSNLYDGSATRINLYNISASGASMTASFALSHTPRFIWGVGDKTVSESKHMNFEVTAEDADGTLPVLSANGIPAGATFTDNLDGSAIFDWPSTVRGTYQVEFVATDADVTDLSKRKLSFITVTGTDGDGNGDGGGGCFIATAAYGSYLHPHVKMLRDFRDEHLLANKIGREIVAWYYKHSPPVAEVISRHGELRWLTRVLLTPVVYAIAYPIVSIGLMLCAMVLLIYTRRRRLFIKE